MTTKLKATLVGGAVAGSSAAGATIAHEYGYPIYFSFEEEGEKNISAQKIIEEIEKISTGMQKMLHFPEKCKITFLKVGTNAPDDASNNLTKESKEKISRKFSGLTGFFKRPTVNAFWRKCKENTGSLKYVQLRWDSTDSTNIGWKLGDNEDLFN